MIDLQNFRNEPATRPAFDMHDDLERIANVRLDRPVGQLDAALQNAAGKPGQSLFRGVRMNCGKRPGVTGVEELQEIEGFSASNLPEDDAVRAVPERGFEEIPDGDRGEPVLFPRGFKAK